MLKRILVPLDGSSRAEQVLPAAIHLAQVTGGTIILLHVINTTQEVMKYGAFFPPDALDVAIGGGQAYLGELIQRNHLTGMSTIEKQVVTGNPAEKILSLAREQHVDLIVMASHGYTGFKQWLMGSVAERVAHLASIPVLIIRDGEPLHTHLHSDGATAIRALVPLDLSDHSRGAILPAAELVAAFSSPGQGALHLTQLIVEPEEASETERATLLRETIAHLEAAGQQVREEVRAHLDPALLPKITWSISIDSDIAEGIVRVAEDGEETPAAGKVERCDLIAMTTHRLSGNQKRATGSITDRVLHATRYPLLIVRPAEVIEKVPPRNASHAQARV